MAEPVSEHKMTMLQPDEVEFLENYCGLSFKKAKEVAGEGNSVPFWSFLISSEPLTQQDIDIAKKLIAEYELSERGEG